MFEGLTIPASWFGTLPQWGMFLLLLIAVVRTSPQWLTTWLEAWKYKVDKRIERIRELELKVKECQDECSRETDRLNDTIRDMEERIIGMRRQHVQEQISLINAIIASVPDPQLRTLLRTLESVQRTLPAEIFKEGAEKDEDNNERA